MNTRPSILIVDRDTVAAQTLEQLLSGQGYQVHIASTLDRAITILHQEQAKAQSNVIGVVLVDQDAGGPSGGAEAVRLLHQERPSMVPIMISAFRKVESAVAAMRLGAADYLLKPIVEHELLDAVQRAAQWHLLLVDRETAQEEIVSQPQNQTTDQSAFTSSGGGGEGGEGWRPMPLSEAMKEPERRILLTALEANDWNRGETAKQLDINRTTLYKKIRQHRLDEPV